MLFTTSLQSWYSFPLFLNREKDLSDDEVIRKIINKTVPKNNEFKLLDVGCGDGKRLCAALKRNPLLQGVGLVRGNQHLPTCWKEQGSADSLKVMVSELLEFRAQPEYDLMYLFESLSYYPVDRRMEMLQYCKMLLRPGGRLVIAAAKNSAEKNLRPAALQVFLQRSGFYKVHNYRLTASLRLLMAERIDKDL